MFVALISLSAALVAGQQSQSMGAAEGLRPLPAPAQEASVPPAAPAASSPEPAAPPRQVCRNIQVTGSRFPVRHCSNAVQTEAERVEAREMLRRMQGSRTLPTG